MSTDVPKMIFAYVLVDIENFLSLHPDWPKNVPSNLPRLDHFCKNIDAFLAKYRIIAPRGCRKVVLGREPKDVITACLCGHGYSVHIAPRAGQDAADEMLTREAQILLKDISHQQHIEIVVIASGDHYFAPLAQELRKRYHTLCLARKPSRSLCEAVDEVILWQHIQAITA